MARYQENYYGVPEPPEPPPEPSRYHYADENSVLPVPRYDEDDELDDLIRRVLDIHVPHYDHYKGQWVCDCKKFQAHGRCEHCFRYRPQEVIYVDQRYLLHEKRQRRGACLLRSGTRHQAD